MSRCRSTSLPLQLALTLLGFSLLHCVDWKKARDQYCAGNPVCSDGDGGLIVEQTSPCPTEAQGAPAAARLVWPLSSGTVSSLRPTLQWTLPTGATDPGVELCATRSCSAAAALKPDGTGLATRPTQALPSGWIYWRVRTLTSAGPSCSPVWQFRVPVLGAGVDTSYGAALDLNGDGLSEIAIGARCARLSGSSCGPGRVYVYSGAGTGFGSSAPVILEGENPGDGFGTSVTSAGDVNGDGYVDLAVGAPAASSFGHPNNGRVYVYAGGPNGVGTTPLLTLDGQDGANTGFGSSVGGAGDLDHDGYADVVVGEPFLSIGGANSAGRIRLYRGGPTAMTALPPIDSPDGANARFGTSVAGAGDMDGNTYSDVIAGEPGKNNGSAGSGGFYVYLFSQTGMTSSHRDDDNFNRNFSDDFGSVVAGNADVNGDGYSDVVVGCNECTPSSGSSTFYTNGYANWYEGAATPGFFSSVHNLPGPLTGSEAHYAFSAVLGDMDGDGRAEAVLGSEFETQARLFPSTSTGLSATPFLLAPAGPPYSFGNGLGMADVDGDNKVELFVGVPAASPGMVYVYKGPITANSPPPMTTLTSPDPGNTDFGRAITGR